MKDHADKILADISDESLGDLYEHAPCGYISTDANAVILRVNQTFLDLTGHTREGVRNLRLPELMTVPGRVFYDTHFAPMVRLQGFIKEAAVDIVRPGQSPLPTLINAVQIENSKGEPTHIRFTIFDATERRRFEQRLITANHQAEHFGVIIQASLDAILSVGPTGDIETWNPGAEKMFGHSSDEAIGKKVWEMIVFDDPDYKPGDLFSEVQKGQGVFRSAMCIGSGGRKMFTSICVTPHIEPPGEFVGLSAIFRDLTEQRQVEEAKHREEMMANLIRAEESERRRISRDLHDHLGQQLTAIRLTIAELQRAAAEFPQLSTPMEKLQIQTRKIDDDLSFFAFELRPKELESARLAEAIEIYVRKWSQNYDVGAEIHVETMNSTRFPEKIENNIYRILQEALNNVAKYASADTVNVIFKKHDGELILIIEDNGDGFSFSEPKPPQDRGHGGLGILGMHERTVICGGRFTIESQPGKGTTVFARIPIGDK